MSKENVVRFSEAANKNMDLRRRIATADTTMDSWIGIAQDAGFDFTADEFESVVESTLGRKLVTNNPVREYLTAPRPGELSDRALESVVGGRGEYMFYRMSDIIVTG
jgi:predicted ribosomally synthesized peptide with nif11-like leader